MNEIEKLCFLTWGEEPENREKILNNLSAPGFNWSFYYGKKEYNKAAPYPVKLESLYDEAFSIPYLAVIAKEAEVEGYKALVINCGGDIGLDVIREAVNIPVIGLSATALHVCSLLGNKICQITTGNPYGVVNILPWDKPPNRAFNIGLTKWVSVRRIGMDIKETKLDPDVTYQNMLRSGKDAIKEEGADVITFGCGSLSWMMKDKELSKDLDIPVVNFIKTAVKFAEMLVSLEISHSKKTYPSPSLYRGREHIGKVE